MPYILKTVILDISIVIRVILLLILEPKKDNSVKSQLSTENFIIANNQNLFRLYGFDRLHFL